MTLISIPVVIQQQTPAGQLLLVLKPDQNVGAKPAKKAVLSLLRREFAGLDFSGVTLSCQKDVPVILPRMQACVYATQYGQIYVVGVLHVILNQLSTLTLAVRELQHGNPRSLEIADEYQTLLRQDILVRSRDYLAAEGGQVKGVSFVCFSSTLTADFLSQRNLNEDTLLLVNGGIHTGDMVAHTYRSSLMELHHGLDGLQGDELDNMTKLFIYVVRQAALASAAGVR